MWVVLLLLSFYTGLYLLKGTTYLDPDFGWHIRMGHFIFQHGIPLTDPLSYTMPSYPMIDIEWLTNVLLYLIHKTIGMDGLSFLFTGLCFLAVFIHIPRKHARYSFLPVLFTVTLLFYFFNVRTQVLSWLFFSLLLRIVFDQTHWRTLRFVLPFLLLFWANMHGSFMLGIVVLLIFMIDFFWRKRTSVTDVVVFVFSFGAMFINPYGYRLFQEVWRQSTDESFHLRYGEWMPLIFHPDVLLIGYMVLSTCFILLYRKKLPAYQLIITGVLLAASLSSVRHVPFFLLLTIPLTTTAFVSLYKEMGRGSSNRLQKGFRWITVCCIFVCLFYSVSSYESVKNVTEDTVYPKQALIYLKQHPSAHQLMSVFEWGGYLDWQLPEKKVFIDGRMPNWRLPHNEAQESSFIYQETEMLLTGYLSLETVVRKYHVDTILYPTAVTSGKILQSSQIGVKPEKKPQYPSLHDQLIFGGWKEVYRDPIAVIYRR